MTILLLLLLALALMGGIAAHSRYGYVGWSPAAVVLAILVLMLLTRRTW